MGIITPQRTQYYMVGIRQRFSMEYYEGLKDIKPMQKMAVLYVLESIATLALRESGWFYCSSSNLNFELSKIGYSISDKMIKNAIKTLKNINLISTIGTKNINYKYTMNDHDAIEKYGYSIYNGNMYTKKETQGDSIW